MPERDREQPLVTVVVLNYNGRDHLEQCLPSLMDLDFPADRLELLVVDNGSTDGSGEVVSRFAPRVQLLACETNRGFSAGNNLGARQARGRYVAFLNNDTRVDTGWLSSLCSTMDGAPDAAAVAGKLLTWDGSRLDFGRGIITFDGHAFQEGAGLPLDKGRDPHDQVAETFIPCGGNMLVRRELFLELGGFDDDYFAYLEDVDLAWRFWASGHRVLFDPGAVAWHRSEGTSGRMDPFDRGFLFERNAFITAVKNLDREYFPRVFPAVLLTLINRTMSLGPRLADKTGLLGRYPFTSEGYVGDLEGHRNSGLGDFGQGRMGALAARLCRWLVPQSEKRRESLLLDHPHSISQLRAVNYILENLDAIMEKRRQVQAKRRVPDRKIFGRFPLHLVPTYPGDTELFQTRFFQWLLAVETERKSLEEIHHRDD